MANLNSLATSGTVFSKPRTAPVFENWLEPEICEQVLSPTEFRNLVGSPVIRAQHASANIPVVNRPGNLDQVHRIESRPLSESSPLSSVEPIRDSMVVGTTARIGDDSNQPSTTTTTVQEITVEELGKRIQEQKTLITENEGLDENAKTELLDQLNKASVSVQKAKDNQSSIKVWNLLIEKHPAVLDKAETNANAELELRKPRAGTNAEALQRELEEKRNTLDQKKNELSTKQSDIREQEKRREQLPTLKSDADTRLKQIEKSFEDLAESPDDTSKTLSKLALDAQKLATDTTINALAIEEKRMKQVEKLLPLERDIVSKEIIRLEAEVKLWETAYKKEEENELKRQLEKAVMKKAEMIEKDPILADLASRNEELTLVRGQVSKLTESVRDDYLKPVQNKVDQLVKSKDDLKRTIDKGLTSKGTFLVEHRLNITQPEQSRLKIQELAEREQQSAEKKFVLENEKKALTSIEDFVQSLVEMRVDVQLPESSFKDYASDLATTKRDYLELLIEKYDDQIATVQDASNKHVLLTEMIQEFKTYVDENAMWVRSSTPLQLADLNHSVSGFNSFLQPQRWTDLVVSAMERMLSRPFEILFAAIALTGIVFVSRRLRTSNDATGQ